MKKIKSYQMPRAQIARQLLLGGLALAATAGMAEAQGCVAGAAATQQKSKGSSGSSSGSAAGQRYQQYNTPSAKVQSVISKSPGCVMGAAPYSGGSGSKSKSGSSGSTSGSAPKTKTKSKTQ